MKQIYKLTDLECAHCAAKMENALKALPQITNVSINFMSQKLILESKEITAELEALIQKIISKIEPDCKLEK